MALESLPGNTGPGTDALGWVRWAVGPPALTRGLLGRCSCKGHVKRDANSMLTKHQYAFSVPQKPRYGRVLQMLCTRSRMPLQPQHARLAAHALQAVCRTSD